MDNRIEEIRARSALFSKGHRAKIVVSPYGQTESVRGIEDAYHQAPADIARLLAEVDRLTERKNEADALREAASSALCLLVEGPEVDGLLVAADEARKALSEALQAARHPMGTYRLTPIQRTLLERRGWRGQDPVPWMLRLCNCLVIGGEE